MWGRAVEEDARGDDETAPAELLDPMRGRVGEGGGEDGYNRSRSCWERKPGDRGDVAVCARSVLALLERNKARGAMTGRGVDQGKEDVGPPPPGAEEGVAKSVG